MEKLNLKASKEEKNIEELNSLSFCRMREIEIKKVKTEIPYYVILKLNALLRVAGFQIVNYSRARNLW